MAFADFVERLLNEGAILLRQRPHVEAEDRRQAARVLEAVYAGYRLEVAGPLLDFDAAVAVRAAECVWLAAWFLLHRDEPAAVVEQTLALPPATGPAQVLSADLVLRFLPRLHGRARAIAADDVLTRSLALLLRRWPLSGVLSDIGDAPENLELLETHPGLLLLYAERLADRYRPAWVPERPAAREHVELVLAQRGLALAEKPAAKLS
jgi:hypothetical protein